MGKSKAANRWKIQGLLAVLLLALFFFAQWFEGTHLPSKERKETLKKKLFDLENAEIAKLEWNTGDTQYKFTCLDLDKGECKVGAQPNWRMDAPYQLKADKSNINSFLTSISNTQATESIDLTTEGDPEKLLSDQYLLGESDRKASSARSITITTKDGSKLTAHFGGTYPIGDGTFAATSENGEFDSSRVLVYPSFFKSNFEKTPTHWRDKSIFSFSSSDVFEFKLEAQDNVNGKKKDGRWTLRSPKLGELPGDLDNVDSVIRAAAYLAAEDFVHEQKGSPEAKAKLRGMKQIVYLNFKRNEGDGPNKAVVEETLRIFEKTKKDKGKTVTDYLYATSTSIGALIKLKNSSKQRFHKSLKDLRMSKLITSLDKFTARRLEFKSKDFGEQAILLENEKSKWSSKNPEVELDEEKVTKLLDRLSGNRIKDFLSGSEYPKGEESAVTLVLGDQKNPERRKISFWKQGPKVYAKDHQSGRNEAFLLESTLAKHIPWDLEHFKKQAVEKKAPEGKPTS